MNHGFISGGPIELENGWAIIPFVGERAHYWERNEIEGFAQIFKGEQVKPYKSLCGVEGLIYAGVPALERGNWPKCKRCMRKSKWD
ncbi:MAG: hypothetical protein KZQ94_10225 [Candidatus Thiodiazotropha sp. (ex Troendleina suluensis)]|nr:hypothetical protein [Candidatus Thiodiazotropha sp. (ex Troendleina suluensis)]